MVLFLRLGMLAEETKEIEAYFVTTNYFMLQPRPAFFQIILTIQNNNRVSILLSKDFYVLAFPTIVM